MRKRHCTGLAVGFSLFACLGFNAPARTPALAPQATPQAVTASKAPFAESAVYHLLGESVLANGCKGGGPHGCMCPLRAATSFLGSFTLTRDPRSPVGHDTYDVVVEDWIVVLDGVESQISGSGRYVAWTDLDGAAWQFMRLDLLVGDQEVSLSSGVVEGPPPQKPFPNAINLSLEDGAECYGFVIVLAAESVPQGPNGTQPSESGAATPAAVRPAIG